MPVIGGMVGPVVSRGIRGWRIEDGGWRQITAGRDLHPSSIFHPPSSHSPLRPVHSGFRFASISCRRDSRNGGSDSSVVTRVGVFMPSTGRTYTALTRDLSMEGMGL